MSVQWLFYKKTPCPGVLPFSLWSLLLEKVSCLVLRTARKPTERPMVWKQRPPTWQRTETSLGLCERAWKYIPSPPTSTPRIYLTTIWVDNVTTILCLILAQYHPVQKFVSAQSSQTVANAGSFKLLSCGVYCCMIIVNEYRWVQIQINREMEIIWIS